MSKLAEFSALPDLFEDVASDFDFFQLDLSEFVNDCGVRFDMPSPPPCALLMPNKLGTPSGTLSNWKPDTAELGTAHADEVTSLMFEQLFFGSSLLNQVDFTPPSTVPSSPISYNEATATTVGPLSLNVALETLLASDTEFASSGTEPVITQLKRPFTLADVDYSGTVMAQPGQGQPMAMIRNGPPTKQSRLSFGPCQPLIVDGIASSFSSTSSPISASSEDLPEHEARRSIHNVLERKRRDDLRASFDGLRVAVPELRAHDNCPKVSILKGASQYIKSLRGIHVDLMLSRQSLLDKQENLRSRLQQLQALAGKLGIAVPSAS